jgi:hypothetical protein
MILDYIFLIGVLEKEEIVKISHTQLRKILIKRRCILERIS